MFGLIFLTYSINYFSFNLFFNVQVDNQAAKRHNFTLITSAAPKMDPTPSHKTQPLKLALKTVSSNAPILPLAVLWRRCGTTLQRRSASRFAKCPMVLTNSEMAKAPMWPVEETCVPPQSSDERTESASASRPSAATSHVIT